MEAAISAVAPYGLGAVMSVLIFWAYQKLVKQVVEVVQANTKASQALCSTVEDLANRVSALEKKVKIDE